MKTIIIAGKTLFRYCPWQANDLKFQYSISLIRLSERKWWIWLKEVLYRQMKLLVRLLKERIGLSVMTYRRVVYLSSINFKEFYSKVSYSALWSIFTTYIGFVIAFGILTYFRNIPAYLINFVLIGAMQYRLVISCHETVHKTLVPNILLNEWIGIFHCGLVGIHFYAYRDQHMAHHRAKKVGDDPDEYIYKPILDQPIGRSRIASYVFGTVLEIYQKFRAKGVLKKAQQLDRPVMSSRYCWISMSIVLVQLALIGVLSISFGFWSYFIFWLFPLLSIAVFLNRTRVLIEHGFGYGTSNVHGHLSPSAVIKSYNFQSNVLERFFLVPFNFSFHALHHKYPAIPHYNLPALCVFNEHFGEAGMIQNTTYVHALSKILIGT